MDLHNSVAPDNLQVVYIMFVIRVGKNPAPLPPPCPENIWKFENNCRVDSDANQTFFQLTPKIC